MILKSSYFGEWTQPVVPLAMFLTFPMSHVQSQFPADPSCLTYSTCNLVIVSIMSNISNHILRPTLLLQPQSSYSQICEKYFLWGSANRTRVGGLLAATSILRREKEKEGGGRWGGREEICVFFCPIFTFTSGWSFCLFLSNKKRGGEWWGGRARGDIQ